MERKRPVKKYSGVNVIKLEPSDMKDFNIETGDEVDISKIIVFKKEK